MLPEDAKYYPKSPKEVPAFRFFYGDSSEQFCDLRLPVAGDVTPATPVVAVIHGGFWQQRWSLELMNAACDDWTLKGAVTWNIEYRRVQGSGCDGSNGGYPNTFEDIVDAFILLESLIKGESYVPFKNLSTQSIETPEVLSKLSALNSTNVRVVGHSAGGHLALWIASKSRGTISSKIQEYTRFPKRVVSLAGVSDFDEGRHLGDDKVRVPTFLGTKDIDTLLSHVSPLHMGEFHPNCEIVSVSETTVLPNLTLLLRFWYMEVKTKTYPFHRQTNFITNTNIARQRY